MASWKELTKCYVGLNAHRGRNVTALAVLVQFDSGNEIWLPKSVSRYCDGRWFAQAWWVEQNKVDLEEDTLFNALFSFDGIDEMIERDEEWDALPPTWRMHKAISDFV